MRRVVNREGNNDQVSQQICESGNYVLFAKEGATSPIHIVLRTPEIIDRNYNPRGQRLILPTSPVVA